MFAIISDIHSNLEALTTVLADIEARGIKTIYCLGDVVGYAANPKECMDMVIEKTKMSVLGNHDYAVLYEPTNFNLGAEQATYWTRRVLEQEKDDDKRASRWEFLGSQEILPILGSMVMAGGATSSAKKSSSPTGMDRSSSVACTSYT